ncbi:MAG TPA: hypothetical protein VNX68_01785 [Nitrosopumilaceae archaeon]|jgi:hypothetical protein|nr:hypothetical protein [Nitrosopumilaceae archaeon]
MQTCLQIYENILVLKRKEKKRKEKKRKDIPLDLFKGDVIKRLEHLLFHHVKSSCMTSNAVAKLCYTLILLNEV